MIQEVLEKNISIHKIISQQNDIYVQIWQEQVVFTGRWWLTVISLIVPWVIWLIIRKKESTGRLLLVGFFVFLITTFLDSIGVPFGIWFYNITPMPYIHSFFMPWDISLFPVTIMLLLQFKPEISPYLKAIFFTLGSVFIAEPFFAWLHIYEPIHWKYYYGIPFYIIIYLLADKVSKIKTFDEI